MGDTAWLNEEEERAWRGWILGTRRALSFIEKDLRSSTGLNVDDYEVLSNLSEAEDHKLMMSDLAGRVVQSASRLSQRIDRMQRDGYVIRERSEEDGRVYFAVLTEAGMSAVIDAAPGHVEAVRKAFIDRLDADEVAFLAKLMPRLAEELRLEGVKKP